MSTTTEPKMIRISTEAHEQLQALAAKDRRTLQGEADWIIEQCFLNRQQNSNGNGRPDNAES